MRRIRRIAGLIAFNLGLTVALVELALRVFPLPAGFSSYLKVVGMLEEQQAAQVRDPRTGLAALRPGQSLTWSIMDGKWTITTVPFPDNPELGLRDDGLNPQARRKVFACGDSYTFGFGVDDAQVWHEQLERRYGGEVDIFNLRDLGNSVADIRDLYPLYKDRFPHDTVFLCIYLGNEFLDCRINTAEKLANPGAPPPSPVASPQPGDLQGNLVAYLKSHSYAVRLAKYLTFRYWAKVGYYNLDTRREVYQPEGSPFVFTIDFEENYLVRTCEKEYSPEMEQGVAAFHQALAELVGLIRQEGRQVYAFVFPFKEQVYWEQWCKRLSEPERYDRFKPNRIVDEALAGQGVEYYDLTEDMVADGRTEVLYWPIDSHWNPAGNERAAELIHGWLSRRGFP
jgi:hypothetical protein